MPPNDWYISLTAIGSGSSNTKYKEPIYFSLSDLGMTTRPSSLISTPFKSDKRIVPGGVVIGRETGTNSILDCPIISRQHLHLVLGSRGDVLAMDLGSMHGTTVECNRMSQIFPNVENPAEPVTTVDRRQLSLTTPTILRPQDMLILGKRVNSRDLTHYPLTFLVSYRFTPASMRSSSAFLRHKKAESSGVSALFANADELAALQMRYTELANVNMISSNDDLTSNSTFIIPEDDGESIQLVKSKSRRQNEEIDIIELVSASGSEDIEFLPSPTRQPLKVPLPPKRYGLSQSVLYDSDSDEEVFGRSSASPKPNTFVTATPNNAVIENTVELKTTKPLWTTAIVDTAELTASNFMDIDAQVNAAAALPAIKPSDVIAEQSVRSRLDAIVSNSLRSRSPCKDDRAKEANDKPGSLMMIPQPVNKLLSGPPLNVLDSSEAMRFLVNGEPPHSGDWPSSSAPLPSFEKRAKSPSRDKPMTRTDRSVYGSGRPTPVIQGKGSTHSIPTLTKSNTASGPEVNDGAFDTYTKNEEAVHPSEDIELEEEMVHDDVGSIWSSPEFIVQEPSSPPFVVNDECDDLENENKENGYETPFMVSMDLLKANRETLVSGQGNEEDELDDVDIPCQGEGDDGADDAKVEIEDSYEESEDGMAEEYDDNEEEDAFSDEELSEKLHDGILASSGVEDDDDDDFTSQSGSTNLSLQDPMHAEEKAIKVDGNEYIDEEYYHEDDDSHDEQSLHENEGEDVEEREDENEDDDKKDEDVHGEEVDEEDEQQDERDKDVDAVKLLDSFHRRMEAPHPTKTTTNTDLIEALFAPVEDVPRPMSTPVVLIPRFPNCVLPVAPNVQVPRSIVQNDDEAEPHEPSKVVSNEDNALSLPPLVRARTPSVSSTSSGAGPVTPPIAPAVLSLSPGIKRRHTELDDDGHNEKGELSVIKNNAAAIRVVSHAEAGTNTDPVDVFVSYSQAVEPVDTVLPPRAKKARTGLGALGLVILGAALGSVGTIVGLMQLAD